MMLLFTFKVSKHLCLKADAIGFEMMQLIFSLIMTLEFSAFFILNYLCIFFLYLFPTFLNFAD